MLTDKELIAKIRELRRIKPRKEWVFLTKNQIFGEEEKIKGNLMFFSLFLKLMKAKIMVFGFVFLGILVGIFGVAQNSLPGDFLYSIKKLTEKSQTIFISKQEKQKMELELTNKRLEELARVVQTNQIKKLTPSIIEVQKSLNQTNKNLKKKQKMDREVLDQTKKILDNKEKVEKVLGIQLGGTEEWGNALVQIVEGQIKDLETRTLTEKEQELLIEAKKNFEAGNYSEALTNILMLNQNK